jgi:hypothetical protein
MGPLAELASRLDATVDVHKAAVERMRRVMAARKAVEAELVPLAKDAARRGDAIRRGDWECTRVLEKARELSDRYDVLESEIEQLLCEAAYADMHARRCEDALRRTTAMAARVTSTLAPSGSSSVIVSSAAANTGREGRTSRRVARAGASEGDSDSSGSDPPPARALPRSRADVARSGVRIEVAV